MPDLGTISAGAATYLEALDQAIKKGARLEHLEVLASGPCPAPWWLQVRIVPHLPNGAAYLVDWHQLNHLALPLPGGGVHTVSRPYPRAL